MPGGRIERTMTKLDYKAVCWFLVGSLVGCGAHEVIDRLLSNTIWPSHQCTIPPYDHSHLPRADRSGANQGQRSFRPVPPARAKTQEPGIRRGCPAGRGRFLRAMRWAAERRCWDRGVGLRNVQPQGQAFTLGVIAGPLTVANFT